MAEREALISPSLLASVPIRKVPKRFTIGMSDWTDGSDCDDEKENDDFRLLRSKRPKHGKQRSEKQRFGDVTSLEELETISKGFVPKNTTKNTKWAVSTFHQWIESRNKRVSAECIDPDILSKPIGDDCRDLCRVLCLFVVEARKANGCPYPARTLYHLLSGLLRYCRSCHPTCPNFLDPKDARFKKLQGTMDTRFRKLRQEGIGAEVKHASIISTDEENMLWERGILGTSSPLALLRSVIWKGILPSRWRRTPTT